MRKLLAILLLISAPALAEIKIDMVSSNFTVTRGDAQIGNTYAKQQTAEEAAVNAAISCLCEVIIHRSPIRVSATDDSGDASPTVVNKKVKWDSPTARENGDFLYPSEISHHVLWYKKEGESEITVDADNGVNVYPVGLTPGKWSFKLKTIDTNGLESNWSKMFTIDIS